MIDKLVKKVIINSFPGFRHSICFCSGKRTKLNVTVYEKY